MVLVKGCVVGGGVVTHTHAPIHTNVHPIHTPHAAHRILHTTGDSLKKATSKGSKTGRFGIGFNSVYHLTEIPQFVSGKNIIWFDPQADSLPGGGRVCVRVRVRVCVCAFVRGSG